MVDKSFAELRLKQLEAARLRRQARQMFSESDYAKAAVARMVDESLRLCADDMFKELARPSPTEIFREALKDSKEPNEG